MDRDRKRREERLERQKKLAESKLLISPTVPPVSRSTTSPDRVQHRKSAAHSRFGSSPLTPNREENDEDLSDDEDLTEEELAEMPWHHAQLYRLYGAAGADNFIHPKIEQKPKKPVPQKLRRQGGRAGAHALWSTLREDSVRKLLRVDRHIPTELKQAYGSFVRQLLRKKRMPVKRNFYATEDVPEMERLLDNSRLVNIADYRHKVGMMHHAAVGNEGRGNVIMHNNPPPDFNNFEGHEGINRYLPSWIHEAWDLESEPEYKRWLMKRVSEEGDLQSFVDNDTLPSEAPGPLAEIPELDELDEYEIIAELANNLAVDSVGDLFAEPGVDEYMPPGNENKNNNNLKNEASPRDEWDFMLVKRKTKAAAATKKAAYQFLTEEDATVPGEFSMKYKEMRENRDIPKPVSATRVQGSRSAMAMVGGSGSAASSRRESSLDSMLTSGRRSLLTQSAPAGSHQEEFCRHYTDMWEPLSMRALVEYKKETRGLGSGEYNYGKPSLWSHKSVGV